MKLLVSFLVIILLLIHHDASGQSSGNWTSIGPSTLPYNLTGQPNGMGRINAIAFDPSNASKIYVGSAGGGLWVTSNGGSTWSTLTDGLATLGVSAIVVDPNNASTIYIGTGDRDNNDAAGLGVWKSTNGGTTWTDLGMGAITISKLIINPSNSNILLAATRSGIYRTTDGGGTWTETSSNSNNYKDIVFKPKHPNVVYATQTNSSKFYRSTDGGVSFSQITSGLTAGNYRGAIGVTPADTNLVYFVVTGIDTFCASYLSTDGGSTFRTKSTTPNIMDYSDNGSGAGGQAWYDFCVSVDTANEKTIYVGGINVFKSIDSGTTWVAVAHWAGGGLPAIHADQHVFAINPLNNTLYVGNDGGIYYTANGGSTWNNISSGLCISEMYKIGQSASRADMMLAGIQDNGTSQNFSGLWSFVVGGDGMVCAIDPTDTNYQYAELYYGNIYMSSNTGNSFNLLTTGAGDWVTPYILSKSNSSTLFVGFNNIWKCPNTKAASPTFTKISNNLGGSNSQYVEVTEQSSADSNYFYMSRNDNKIFFSSNINATTPHWTNLTSSLPNTNSFVVDIKTHPHHASWLYIIQNQGIYISKDTGTTWTDITGTLPGIAKNTLVIDKTTNSGIYVGTDAGVYYRDSSMTDWTPFYTGLPSAVTINDLAIYYDPVTSSNSKIKAGTYGRGAWVSNLYSAGALPVTLLDFTATLEDKAVKLNWATASEINNAYFTIERSQNGINFQPLLKEPGAGNSQVRINYSAWDETPISGISYYRLKQTDYNGAFEYSMIRPIYIQPIPVNIQIFPNPFSASTTLEYKLDSANNIQISLFDISGKEIGLILNENQQAGNYQIDINAEKYNLNPGIYIIKFISNNGFVNRSIVKF